MSTLRLAFVSTYDTADVRSWSGIPYHLSRALTQRGVTLELIRPRRERIGVRTRLSALMQRMRGHHHYIDLDPRTGRAFARQVAARLARLDVDAVLSIGSLPVVAYLETTLPVIHWTDATFASLVDYYADFTGLSEANIRGLHDMERSAIERTALCIYTSEWAATRACDQYATRPEKVRVLPFAANLSIEPTRDAVAAFVAARPIGEVRLLFLGVDWIRKGGDLALAVTSGLVEKGIPARLIVAGPPPHTVPSSPLIDLHGFIDKSTPDGNARFAALLSGCHFLCLPSRAEAFGIVFSEASAFGVPSFATRTGGIPSVVRNGVNGYLFDERDFVREATRSIAHHVANYASQYVPLALAAHEEFRERLNWATATSLLIDEISRVVPVRKLSAPAVRTRTPSPGIAPDVAVVVVNYRTTDLTIDCVESVLRSTNVTSRVLIVDNASRDDGVARFRQHFANEPAVSILARDVNDGYAGGNNAGIDALSFSETPILILNSDTIVATDCLRLMLDELATDPLIALVSPRIFLGDDPTRLWFGGARYSRWTARPAHIGVGKTLEHGWTTRRDVPCVSGCALLIRRSTVTGAVFDASLFAYAEDLDLSLRLRDRGYRFRYVPDAAVWHFEGSSHRQSGGQAFRYYLNTRNLLRVNARYARWYRWPVLAPMLAVNVVARFCAVAIRDKDARSLGAVLRGAWDAVVPRSRAAGQARYALDVPLADRKSVSY